MDAGFQPRQGRAAEGARIVPEAPNPKLRFPPIKDCGHHGTARERPTHFSNRENGSGPANGIGQSIPYAELHCKTNFSFLRGASHPEELVQTAAVLGYRGLAATDRNTLAGVV